MKGRSVLAMLALFSILSVSVHGQTKEPARKPGAATTVPKKTQAAPRKTETPPPTPPNTAPAAKAAQQKTAPVQGKPIARKKTVREFKRTPITSDEFRGRAIPEGRFGRTTGLLLPTPTPSPTDPTIAVTLVSVQPAGNASWEKTCSEAYQDFLATGERLTGGHVAVTGTSRIQIIIRNGDGTDLYNRTMTPTSSGVDLSFSPPLNLRVGETCMLWLVNPAGGSMKIKGSNDRDAYVFSTPALKISGNWEFAPGDLGLTLTGLRSSVVPADPNANRPARTRKALIVFVENGGFDLRFLPVLDQIDLPEVRWATCGDFRFDMNPGESLASLISRVRDRILSNASCLNPANWTEHRQTFDEWWRPKADFIAEEMYKAVRDVQEHRGDQKYDEVVVLEDQAATAERLIQEIVRLAPGNLIDIHTLCHGYEEGFVGYDQKSVDLANFFRVVQGMRLRGELNYNLRSVYQMNCESGTLVRKWQALGAAVVDGTQDTNLNFMPLQYQYFNRRWLDNETFQEAIDHSFDDAKPFFEGVWVNAPERVEESRLHVHGDGGLRMSTNP